MSADAKNAYGQPITQCSDQIFEIYITIKKAFCQRFVETLPHKYPEPRSGAEINRLWVIMPHNKRDGAVQRKPFNITVNL